MKKVSVIIPILNGESYIEDCYRYLNGQTLKDIEIIFVDNGSTDTSTEQVRSLVNKDKRVRLLSELKRGAGYARNKGIDYATGEFVFFLDVDDCLPEADSLEILYSTALREHVNICGGRYVQYVDGIIQEDKIMANPINILINKVGEQKVKFVDYQYDYGYTGYLYRLDLLNNNQIRFPSYQRHQDPPFFVRSMLAADVFCVCNAVTYGYMSSREPKPFNIEKAVDVIKGCKEEFELAKNYGLTRLADYVVKHLNGGYYCWQILKAFTEDGHELLKELISVDLLVKENFPEIYRQNGGVKPLVELMKMPVRMEKDRNNYLELLRMKQWKFPYDKLHDGDEIVIWGGGDVGHDMYEQAIRYSRYKVVAWVDRKYHDLGDERIVNPNKIIKLGFDFILVATCRKKIQDEITDELLELGIKKEKIITFL